MHNGGSGTTLNSSLSLKQGGGAKGQKMVLLMVAIRSAVVSFMMPTNKIKSLK